jgi:DNA-binding NarL/FixJ family response regulator
LSRRLVTKQKRRHTRPTPRQVAILKLIAAGQGTGQIARQLGINRKVVETEASLLMEKLEVESLAGLLRRAPDFAN